MTTPQKADLRDYLAAERTFLAWVRTGLALMGFGFVVARFGLFLQQMQIVSREPIPRSTGLSLWFGTALIAAGITVNLASAWRHVRIVRQLDAGDSQDSRSLAQPVITAIFLALVGLAMAIYLLSVRSSAQSSLSLDFTKNEATAMSTASTQGAAPNGVVERQSAHSVDQTVEKLKNILQAKGVMLFALIDHSGEAEKAGLKMPNTKLLIFGNPKGGTPLMLAAPSTAIDLPLKILVREDPQGKVWIAYNSPEYLRQRHGFPQDLLKNISVVEALAAAAAE